MTEIKLHDEVVIKETGEEAYVVWIDEDPEHDSYLLEIKEKNETPKFYKRKDFELKEDTK